MWVGMRIRITDVDYVLPPDYGDPSLRDFGISVGDEFEAVDALGYGFIVETDYGLLFISCSECEVLED